MRHLIILCFSGLLMAQIQAQPLGLNLSLGLRKTFKINAKSNYHLRQQFQISPEIERYDNEYGDFFNEDGFWPIPDRRSGNNTGLINPKNELDDTPRIIHAGWRSSSYAQFNHAFFPWLRTNQGYTLFFNGEEWRHTFRAELDYRPMRHGKTKYKVDFAARGLIQVIGRPEEGAYRWRPFFVPRFDAEWAFMPNHILAFSNSLNGIVEGPSLQFDRWRMRPSLVFIYQKIHRFSIVYQMDRSIEGKKRTHGFSFEYEIRI